MKKSLLLTVCLAIGASSAAYADNAKPGNSFVNGIYCAAWAVYATPGWIYGEIKNRVNRHHNLLRDAQRYLKSSYGGICSVGKNGLCITVRAHGAIAESVGVFVAENGTHEYQPDIQQLLRISSIQKEQFGVVEAFRATHDIKAGLEVLIDALQRMMPHLWKPSTIEDYTACLQQVQTQYVFVCKLLMLLEQSDAYKAQLAQKQAQKNGHDCNR